MKFVTLLTPLFFLLVSISIPPLPSFAQEGESLYISEVYYSQSPYSSRDKWVEIHNPTSTSISLEPYSLAIGKSSFNLPLSGIVEPGGYYVVQDSWGNEQHMLETYGVPIDLYSGRVHWLSNKSTEEMHVSLQLLLNSIPVQNIFYNSSPLFW